MNLVFEKASRIRKRTVSQETCLKIVRRNILGRMENAAGKSFTMGESASAIICGRFFVAIFFSVYLSEKRKKRLR